MLRGGRRHVTQWLVACGLTMLIVAGAPAAFAEVVDEGDEIDALAERLRQNPILVDDVMGNGHTDDVRDVLTDLAQDVEGPVYVVLTGAPESLLRSGGDENDLAALLHRELGDGLYLIGLPEGLLRVNAWGPLSAATSDIDRAVREARDQSRSGDEGPRLSTAYEAAVALVAAQDPGSSWSSSDAGVIGDVAWQDRAAHPNRRADARGDRIVYTAATALSLLIAGGVWILLGIKRPLGERPADGPEAVAVPGDVAEQAEVTIEQVRVRALSAPDQRAESLRQSLDHLDAARAVLATGDPLDAVGALVLARQADYLLDYADHLADLDARGSEGVYRPCFVNPLHGEAKHRSEVPGSSLRVPVCGACRDEPQPYIGSGSDRRALPYIRTDTVWSRTGFGSLVDDLAQQVIADREAR